MNAEKKRVLIVDDQVEDIHFLLEHLKSDYAVTVATSGKKAIESLASQAPPDVILMDVEMPNMDGYDTCRTIKGAPETEDIPVIFVSAHDTIEQKLAGYDAGGDDYVIKPASPVEVSQKVKLAIENSAARVALESEKKMAMETAMTALSSTGELGVVLEFLRQSFTVTDPHRLSELIIAAMEQYSLDCNVQIRSSIRLIDTGSNGPNSPLSSELLLRLHNQGRIFEHGKRLVMNFGAISILIKNMPVDDEDKRGRLRDNIAILLEGADAKLGALEIEHQDQLLRQQLQNLVDDSKAALQDIEQLQQMQKETSIKIMDKLLQDLETSFFKMGLTEEQEETLLNLTRNGIERALENRDAGAELDAQLRKITENLQRFANA
jgi:CheY-like chemotaxis protein